jgi:hypothetical protein
VCKESATADDVHAAMPHPVVGSAADPIALEPVDDVGTRYQLTSSLPARWPDLACPGHGPQGGRTVRALPG